MRRNLAIAALLAGLAAWPATAIAQEAADTSATAIQLSEADAHFAEQAAAGGKAEVDLGTLAVEKAESAEVKQFGQMMIDDHGKANEELAAIVEQQDATAPDVPPEAQQTRERLAALSGGEFDRAYIDQMVTDHEKMVGLFQTEVESGENMELKTFAENTLPTLQTHLEHAQQLQAQLSQVAGADDTAADPAADPESIAPAAGTTQQAALPANPLGEMTADELIGKNVVNEADEEVGEIQDIVINGEDEAVLAVISVGGFLGIGDKNVAVPFAELQQGEDKSVVLSGATEEQLTQMPAYDEATGYEAYPRDQPLNPDTTAN